MRRQGRGRLGVTAGVVALGLVCASWLALGRAREEAPPRQPERARIGSGPLGTTASDETARGAGEIPFASPHAHAVETPSAPGAWGGPRTGSEPTLSDRVVTYRIDAALDPVKHTVTGHELVTWRNRSDRAVRTIFLHLYLNAFEGPGSTFFTERRELGFGFRRGVAMKDGEWGHAELTAVKQGARAVPWSFVHPDGGPETDHTVVRVDLADEVPAGAEAQLDVAFLDQLPRVIARTGWFGTFHFVGQWFPKVGVLELPGERGATAPRWNVHEFHLHSEFYADWGSYDVRLTVPRGYEVAAAGEEQGAPVEEGGNLTHHFVADDVHDFAWAAAPGYRWLESAWQGPGSPKVRVRVFYPPEDAAAAPPTLQATLDSLTWFSDTLGPYPYRTSTAVIPPFNAEEAGGMEYQTLFTTVGFRSVPPKSYAQYLLDFVTIHEFGHGYFYGLLASNEFEEPLLDEGMNQYWDKRMLRARGEDLWATTPLLRALGIAPVIEGFAMDRGRSVLPAHPPDPIGENSWDRLTSESYGSVYGRTSVTMHDLEELLGKETMERAMKAYYARWKFRHPSTADLREVLAEVSGRRAEVEAFFAQHVYEVGPIDDAVESVESEEVRPLPRAALDKGVWTVETEKALGERIDHEREAWKKAHPDAKRGTGPYPFRTQVTVRRLGAPVPQRLVVTFADGSVETVSWDDDRAWRRFAWVKPVRVVKAELDPDRHWLLDRDKLNDARTREGDGRAARRWSADAGALLETLLAFVGSL